ncbi:MAG: hypothetical protein A2X32_08750 [Elusimicrobia bacterium GWC2_64_44]|nr:MAG: hypothetical protein A2X32_08750 [Elusimicrobia bacterium GWC2_64_44]
MKKATTGTLALLAAVFSVAGASAQGEKGIYGGDDRQDYYQASEARRKLADSTVAFFKAAQVAPDGRLALANYGEKLDLCKGEAFRDQPIGAFCSGTLVAPDLVMTAGHCIKSNYDCSEAKMVFGYAVKSAGANPDRVDPSDVYSCKSLVVRDQDDSGPDYALIRLDRPVTNREPLPINRAGKVTEGTRLFVIGHPVGLPVKVAGGASVRRVSFLDYFTANLDTYGGNSGSAVFNEATGLIEGILVRGGKDFELKKSLFSKCNISVKVADSEGRGEDVTSVSVLARHIPLPGQEALPVETPVQTPNPILGNCTDPGPGATIEQLMAYVDCLTSQLNSKP